MADVIKTERTAFVFKANGLLLTKISLPNVKTLLTQFFPQSTANHGKA
jgi:hypothetical protein